MEVTQTDIDKKKTELGQTNENMGEFEDAEFQSEQQGEAAEAESVSRLGNERLREEVGDNNTNQYR